jgi:hypothetical protein
VTGQDRSPPLGDVIEDLHRQGIEWAMREAGTASPDAEEAWGAGSTHVTKCAGITYRKLDYWVRLGHLQPGGGVGTGNDRWWPPAEIEIARRMGRLTAAGLPLELAASFAREGWPSGEIAPGITLEVAT